MKQLYGHACGINSFLASNSIDRNPSVSTVRIFFAPRATLVVEVDGSQPLGSDHALKDRRRDGYLVSLGLTVLRVNSREVLEEGDAVAEAIYRTVAEQLSAKIPPGPPLIKGG